MGLYHIAPIYKSFVWGGRRLVDRFLLPRDLENVGTIYHVIAMPGHLDNEVVEAGVPLSRFYSEHRELFGCESEELPIRMTTTCNEGRQSYQLHPTDAYALEHDGERGKVSGSVALDEDGTVSHKLFGNACSSREEFVRLVEDEDWEHLFATVDQRAGDFLHTPAGVIHGGEGHGAIVCTFSTNGDLTYRFYDYGRDDPSRPLEPQKVYDCVNIPEVPVGPRHIEPVEKDGVLVYEYYDQPGEYTARRMKVVEQGTYECPEFWFVACVGGGGTVDGVRLGLGETLLVPCGYGPVALEGKMDLICVSYKDAEREVR